MNKTILSELGSLTKNDFIKSAITSVFAAIVVAVAGIVSQPGFDLFHVDLTSVVHVAINVAVATFFADLVRRLGTDSSGKLLGKVG